MRQFHAKLFALELQSQQCRLTNNHLRFSCGVLVSLAAGTHPTCRWQVALIGCCIIFASEVDRGLKAEYHFRKVLLEEIRVSNGCRCSDGICPLIILDHTLSL